MKEKVINIDAEKQYTFSTYFVINRGILFCTNNFHFEDNLKNCFCIKNFGSNIHPKIYLDTKVDNNWMNKNQFLGDYYSFIDFISQNQNSFICIKGFSRADISQVVGMANELKSTNIKLVKFKSQISSVRYERHLATKEKRIEELKEKSEKIGEIESAKQYMEIYNSVFNKNRHKSRRKIIQLKRKDRNT